MKTELFRNIVDFIIEIRGQYKKEITLDSELECDLKITGDDAFEFFERYSNKFNVDLSDFHMSNYFAQEGTLNLYLLLFLRSKSSRKTIYIKDLISGIESGKLVG